MVKNPKIEDRIKWHLEHRKNCACRPIPRKLYEEIFSLKHKSLKP